MFKLNKKTKKPKNSLSIGFGDFWFTSMEAVENTVGFPRRGKRGLFNSLQ